MKPFARWLNSQGYWVYVLRLPGHGTCAEDLAGRVYSEWIDAVEAACVLLDTLCTQVLVGGVGLGGNLALHVAARAHWIKGVFSVSAPFPPQRLLHQIHAGHRRLEYHAPKDDRRANEQGIT